jgi:disulfide oxidoreductase YuzD
VRYYDALSPQVRDEHQERMKGFEERRWPYPVSLVDGQVISVGSLSVYALIQAVEQAQRGNEDGR